MPGSFDHRWISAHRETRLRRREHLPSAVAMAEEMQRNRPTGSFDLDAHAVPSVGLACETRDAHRCRRCRPQPLLHHRPELSHGLLRFSVAPFGLVRSMVREPCQCWPEEALRDASPMWERPVARLRAAAMSHGERNVLFCDTPVARSVSGLNGAAAARRSAKSRRNCHVTSMLGEGGPLARRAAFNGTPFAFSVARGHCSIARSRVSSRSIECAAIHRRTKVCIGPWRVRTHALRSNDRQRRVGTEPASPDHLAGDRPKARRHPHRPT